MDFLCFSFVLGSCVKVDCYELDMFFCSRGARSGGCGVLSWSEIGIGLELGFLAVF